MGVFFLEQKRRRALGFFSGAEKFAEAIFLVIRETEAVIRAIQ